MPTENERKFVLVCDRADEELRGLRATFRNADILQGYLVRGKKVTVRVRSAIDYAIRASGTVACLGRSYSLTTKRLTAGRVVEVEAAIDERDFGDLWDASKGRLSKVRVEMGDWEVDYFLGEGGVYFVLAEVELPEGKDGPDEVIPFVRDRLLYEVPRGDDRFSNRKLGKVKYARNLLNELER